jgi:hypothetical protein
MTRRRPRHSCDVCGHSRPRRHRICDVCFGALPPKLRTDIIENWRLGKLGAWRTAKQAAIDFIGEQVRLRMEAYQRSTAALLGERDDA